MFNIARTDPSLPRVVGSVGPDPSIPVVPMRPVAFGYPGIKEMNRRDGGTYLLVPSQTLITGLAANATTSVEFEGTAQSWYEILGFCYQTFASGGGNAGEPINLYPISIRTQSPNSRLEPVVDWTAISNVASQGRGRTNEQLLPVPWVLTLNNTLRVEFRNDGATTVDLVFYAQARRHDI